MPALEHLAWTDDVSHARWLTGRLGDHGANVVTAIVPMGFEAYARVLHPAGDPVPGGRRLVRWREVADWSGRTLRPDSPFHGIALPERQVVTPPPWSGEGPRQGSLAAADAEALIAVVRRHTRTPEDCWFCLWDGYGGPGTPLTRTGSGPGALRPEAPIPASPRNAARVELPDRDYFLYRGRVESALVHDQDASVLQTANLWWPEDQAWCVASDVDQPCTYVAGSVALVRSLVGDPALEALEVAPDDPVTVVEPRIAELVRPAVDALFGDGRGRVVTPLGSVDAELQLPRRIGRGWLRYTRRSALGSTGSGAIVLPSGARRDPVLRDTVARHLQDAVIGLVGG